MRRGWVAAGLVGAAAAVLTAALLFSRDTQGSHLAPLLDRVAVEGAPGAFVVVWEDGEVRAWERGLAAPSVPIRADQRFRIGSVTKTFVATLVLMLVDDGRVSLDDSVERWLPGQVPDGRAITVRQLLSHTSGLFDYVDDPRVLRAPSRRWRPTELVGLAVARDPLAPPGRRFAYASTNYVLLGEIVQKAGRAPLGRQLRDRIFDPLGLRRTSYVPGVVTGTHVHGHRPPQHQGVVTGRPVDVSDEAVWWAGAAGAIVSTADDLHRFYRALLRGRLLGPATMSQMTRLVPAGAYRYGLGLATFPTPCGPAWGHTGNVQGTITVAWNTRDASRQVVLVVNVYPLSSGLESAVRELQDAAFCNKLSD